MVWQESSCKFSLHAICEKNNAKCEKMRLSKCVKHFDSTCVKIDAEDEEGRYVYRSEIWQALKFDFHKWRQNKVCTYSVDFNTFRVEIFNTFFHI